jgi:two-component system phosphate regulon sensor histidine kinase PhoR
MGKRIFFLIVFLMSISLIGIIAVQVYWINSTIENKKEQFKNDVHRALASATDRIKESEDDKVYQSYKEALKNKNLADKTEIKNYLFQLFDKSGKQRLSVGTTILEENFKVPTDFLDSNFLDNDSILIKRITTKKDYFKASSIKSDGDLFGGTSEERFSFTDSKDFNKRQALLDLEGIKDVFPIVERVSNRELNTILKEELEKKNISIDYKYGVYTDDGFATPLKSGYFTIDTKDSQSYPLFQKQNGESNHKLYITFPNKNKHILSGISGILILSLFFIFIIIIAFSSSLYQLIRQKKLSEIKTDFINNMTHEFKTPIATINLALDSIKNPKIINDQEKVLRYVNMIRQENKRMHAQVESVLQISKFEKKQMEMSKEPVDGNDIIDDAISHVSLLVLDRKGTIKTHFEAIQTEVLGNQFHLTNLFVNVLENAIKYSVEAPTIEVFSESTSKFFILKIVDKGVGMSKNVQKHIFEKFYREQKGNIHNVKGHGLGLAYVKEIIDNHQGSVIVESEKGKGSTFTIKLPLI